MQLLHVTREAFLFVSACMLTYSVRDLPGIDHRTFWRRRFALVAVPYLCWTVIYFFLTIRSAPGTVSGDTLHLLYLVGTGYYQLYYLLVLLEFYALFPLCLVLVRRTVGHHGLLLLASGLAQVVLVSSMHWGLAPSWMTGYWATREVTSYQFYLIAGMVMAMHLDEFHQWLCAHVWTIVLGTVAAAGAAEAWYYLSVDHVASWLGSSSDPFQPIVIPFNVGAIACIYLIGVALGRSAPLHAHPAGHPVRVGQLLRRVPGPAAVHHPAQLAGLAPAQRRPALAGGQRAHGRPRVHGLHRPDRGPGPHALEQAAHRALAGPVAGAHVRRARPRPSPRAPRPRGTAERTSRGAQSDLRSAASAPAITR